jgi:hypothetical protein
LRKAVRSTPLMVVSAYSGPANSRSIARFNGPRY